MKWYGIVFLTYIIIWHPMFGFRNHGSASCSQALSMPDLALSLPSVCLGHGLCLEPAVHIEFLCSGFSCYRSAVVIILSYYTPRSSFKFPHAYPSAWALPLHTMQKFRQDTGFPRRLLLSCFPCAPAVGDQSGPTAIHTVCDF